MQYISTKGSNSVKSAPLYFFLLFFTFFLWEKIFSHIFVSNKTNKMKTSFEKKIAKFERKLNTSRNYYEKVWRLTDGFWRNHGIKLDEMLTDLQENNAHDWKNYCKTKGWFPLITVSDFFAY